MLCVLRVCIVCLSMCETRGPRQLELWAMTIFVPSTEALTPEPPRHVSFMPLLPHHTPLPCLLSWYLDCTLCSAVLIGKICLSFHWLLL